MAVRSPRRHLTLQMAPKLKSYPAQWHDHRLVLACRKCQKKLKHQDDLKPMANLKRTIKKHNQGRPTPLHILNVKCMNLCPKNAVTLCIPVQAEGRLLILRSEANIDELYLTTTPVASLHPQ